jgi:putative addiction module component (TIGR02574 family)
VSIFEKDYNGYRVTLNIVQEGGNIMGHAADDILASIRSLNDIEKLRLVDEILTQLDKPDQELDRIWAEEARKRWNAYKAGKIETVSYEEIMSPYRRS